MTAPSITCPHCGMTSYNTDDIEHGYCGNCHEFWRDEIVDRALMVMAAYPPYTDEHGVYHCSHGQMIRDRLARALEDCQDPDVPSADDTDDRDSGGTAAAGQ